MKLVLKFSVVDTEWLQNRFTNVTLKELRQLCEIFMNKTSFKKKLKFNYDLQSKAWFHDIVQFTCNMCQFLNCWHVHRLEKNNLTQRILTCKNKKCKNKFIPGTKTIANFNLKNVKCFKRINCSHKSRRRRYLKQIKTKINLYKKPYPAILFKEPLFLKYSGDSLSNEIVQFKHFTKIPKATLAYKNATEMLKKSKVNLKNGICVLPILYLGGGRRIMIYLRDLEKIHDPKEKPAKLYQSFINRPINYDSLIRRFSFGRLSFLRSKMLKKGICDSARCTIVCDPNLKANEVILNEHIYNVIGKPNSILIVRFPSLDTQNMIYAKVIGLTAAHVITLPLCVMGRMSGDFDGDTASIFGINNYLSLAEAEQILDPATENLSLNFPKYIFTEIVIVGLYIYYYLENQKSIFPPIFSYLLKITSSFKEALDHLINIYCRTDINPKITLDRFHRLEQLAYKITEKWGFTMNIHDLLTVYEYMKTNDDLENIKHISFIIPFISQARGDISTLYPIFKSLGNQNFMYNIKPYHNKLNITDNFLIGLNFDNYILHAQSSRTCGIFSKLEVSDSGYCYNKLCTCLGDVTVQYDNTLTLKGSNIRIFNDSEDVLPYNFPTTPGLLDFIVDNST
jgi:hypothetical protein